MMAFALETGTPCNSFLICSNVFEKQVLCCLLWRNLKPWYLYSIHFKDLTHFKCLLNKVIFVTFSTSKLPERINKILCVYLWHSFYQWETLNPHKWSGHKFFHDPIKVIKIYSSFSSLRMVSTLMAYNSSRVKSINLKWLYFCST